MEFLVLLSGVARGVIDTGPFSTTMSYYPLWGRMLITL